MVNIYPFERQCEEIPPDRKFVPFQLARLALTLLLFFVAPTNGTGPRGMIVMVLLIMSFDFLDILAFGASERRLTDPDFYANAGRSDYYQLTDKLIDQVQYVVALAIMWNWPQLQPPRRAILIIALCWRWIGLWVLRSNPHSNWLLMFPDVFKELLVLWAIVPSRNPLLLCGVLVGKVLFEAFQKTIKLHC
jgi:hypothetical protein